MRTLSLTLLLLAGCGVDETVFIPDYTDLYCDALIECTDPAVLTFDGIDGKDDCLSTVGPELEDEVGRCDYSPKQAKRCLKAMEGMGCPGEDQSLADILPLDCATVSENCTAPKETKTTGPTGGTTGTTPTTSGDDGA